MRCEEEKGIQAEQDVKLGSPGVPIRETGCALCDSLCKRPHQLFQICHLTAPGPDLAHGLHTPVNILRSCFISIFIGCSVLKESSLRCTF